MRRGFGSLAALLVVGALVTLPAGAGAATIGVDIDIDQFGGPTPIGQDPFCSLREAVQAANTDLDFDGCERVGLGAADTIVLTGGTTYTRSRGGSPENENVSGDLDITGKTTIAVEGTGRATIDANDMDRVIEVHPGARLTASRLALTDGYVNGIESGTGGGGIRSSGRLELRSSTLFDNEAQPGGSGCGCGGGIENRGRMALRRVDVVHNLATYNGGGIFAGGEGQKVSQSSIQGNTAFTGGGLYAYSHAIRITRSTISQNDATGGTFNDDGGGIYVGTNDDQPFTLVNSTVSGNRAADSGGGIFRFSGPLALNAVTVTSNTADFDDTDSGHGGGVDGGLFGPSATNIKFRNSIIAGNFDLNSSDPALDCVRMTSGFGAHNLLEEGGGCPAGQSDVKVPDAKLKPLADNGGPTFTHALRHSSSAIGLAGPRAPARDQRGRKRDAHPDAGAFER